MKVKNPIYFNELRRLLRLSHDDMLRELDLSEYTKRLESKYYHYHTKQVLVEDHLTRSGLRAWI